MPPNCTALRPRLQVPTSPKHTPAVLARLILLVEDEPLLRMLISDAMTDIGYRVVDGRDGTEGLRVLHASGPVDILIADLVLPGGMDGRQLADAARLVQPGLPVLFITGSAEMGTRAVRPGEPATGMLLKPFRLDRLVQATAALLNRAGSAAPASPPPRATADCP